MLLFHVAVSLLLLCASEGVILRSPSKDARSIGRRAGFPPPRFRNLLASLPAISEPKPPFSGTHRSFESEKAFEEFSAAKIVPLVEQDIDQGGNRICFLRNSTKFRCLAKPCEESRDSDSMPDILVLRTSSNSLVSAGGSLRAVPGAVAVVGDRKLAKTGADVAEMLSAVVGQSLAYARDILHGFGVLSLWIYGEVFDNESGCLFVVWAQVQKGGTACLNDPVLQSAIETQRISTLGDYSNLMASFWHAAALESTAEASSVQLFPSKQALPLAPISLRARSLLENLTPSTELGFGVHCVAYQTHMRLEESDAGLRLSVPTGVEGNGVLFDSSANSPHNLRPAEAAHSQDHFLVARVYTSLEGALAQAVGLAEYGGEESALISFRSAGGIAVCHLLLTRWLYLPLPLPCPPSLDWTPVKVALKRIHAKGGVHRDIAVNNLMVNGTAGEMQVVLVDYGFVPTQQGSLDEVSGTIAGLPSAKLRVLARNASVQLPAEVDDDWFALGHCRRFAALEPQLLEHLRRGVEASVLRQAPFEWNGDNAVFRALTWLGIRRALKKMASIVREEVLLSCGDLRAQALTWCARGQVGEGEDDDEEEFFTPPPSKKACLADVVPRRL